MPEITITLTDFEVAVLEHKYLDVTEYATNIIRGRIDQYANNLVDRLVKRAIAATSKKSMTMDREGIINLMFNEEGYLNAAERKAVLDEAQPVQQPEGAFPDLIV